MEELRVDQGTHALRLGTSLLRPAHTRLLLIAALGLPLIALVGIVWLAEGRPDASGIWKAIWSELVEDPENRTMLWASTVLLPVGVGFLLLQTRARLRVTSVGLEMYVPRWLGFGLLRQTSGNWALRWDEVSRVRLFLPARAPHPAQRLGTCRLVIETPQLEAWLAPFSWFDAAGPDHRLGLGDLIAFRKLDVVERLHRAPLIRAVKARRELEIEDSAEATEPGNSGFDLAKHKGMLAQIGLLFGVGVYALVDTFFIEGYLPLAPLPALPFAAAGIVATVGAWRLGQGAPSTERLAVGALVVVASVTATYPATLRLNASTAEGEVVAYVSTGEGRFAAPVDRLPPIDLSGENVPEYWSQYPPGTIHEFTLLKGAADIYQLELGPFYALTRDFYRH